VVVESEPFSLFFQSKDFINNDVNIKNSFSGEVKDSVIFPPFFKFQKRHKTMLPPCPLPRPPIRPPAKHPLELLAKSILYSDPWSKAF